MNRYTVEFEQAAKKFLKKLDKATANMLWAWIKKNLEDTDDPRRIGKALHGKFEGSWRYRIGSYRIIAHIDDVKITILVLAIGHRREIYQ